MLELGPFSIREQNKGREKQSKDMPPSNDGNNFHFATQKMREVLVEESTQTEESGLSQQTDAESLSTFLEQSSEDNESNEGGVMATLSRLFSAVSYSSDL